MEPSNSDKTTDLTAFYYNNLLKNEITNKQFNDVYESN